MRQRTFHPPTVVSPALLRAALCSWFLLAGCDTTPAELSQPPADVSPDIRILSGNHQASYARATLPLPLTVWVTDGAGRPVSGVGIEWAVDARGGEVRPVATPSVTDAAGLASATRIMGNTGGIYNTRASIAGEPGRTVIFSATVRATDVPTPMEPPEIFDRTAAHQFPLNAYSRYLLFADGAFILEYEGQAFGYGGRFVRNDSTIVFNFADSSLAGAWVATGAIRGDSIVVSYNLVMMMTDFEDGTYVRR
jgi:hypothetical protein